MSVRALLAAALLVVFAAAPARAQDVRAAYDSQVRDLDGMQFLEDEPIWLCATAPSAPAAADGWAPPAYRLRGRDAQGRAVTKTPALGARGARGATAVPRAFELGQTFGFHDPTNRFPLWGTSNSVPAGDWEVHALEGDTARVLARFRVIAARGSERSVRDGLARAARLARSLGRPADAAALYAAIYQRYPRTAYLSAVYWGEWDVRAHTRFAHDPGRWIEEVFAHFHDTCFGVVALDRWVGDLGAEKARPILVRLVGIYPDTPLSRAALRYL